MTDQIQSDSHARDRVKIAFTDGYSGRAKGSVPRYDNMGARYARLDILNMLLRVANIVPVSDMTGIIEFGGIGRNAAAVFGAPSYWHFECTQTQTPDGKWRRERRWVDTV